VLYCLLLTIWVEIHNPRHHPQTHPRRFPLAEQAWTHYHGQKADPKTERIWGVFENGTLAAIARCTRLRDCRV